MATTSRKTSTSKDGATISYLEYAHTLPVPTTTNTSNQPGLIILHGGLESSRCHTQLAQALAPYLYIYLPDRRGRGYSSPDGESFCMQTEIDDLEALLRATGARSILGVSGGALVTLHAALALKFSPSTSHLLQKIAVFEPGLVLNDAVAFEKGRLRLEVEIQGGKTVDALFTALEISEMGSWLLRALPRWLLIPLANWRREREEAGMSEEEKTYSMWTLAPTLRFDFRLIQETLGSLENLERLNRDDLEVLLLSAGRSPEHLRESVKDDDTEGWICEVRGTGSCSVDESGERGRTKPSSSGITEVSSP